MKKVWKVIKKIHIVELIVCIVAFAFAGIGIYLDYGLRRVEEETDEYEFSMTVKGAIKLAFHSLAEVFVAAWGGWKKIFKPY